MSSIAGLKYKINTAIIERMDEYNIKQSHLAKVCGFTQPKISRIYNRKIKGMSLETLLIVAYALSLNINLRKIT